MEIYIIVIDGLLKEGNLVFVLDFYVEMLVKGIRFDVVIYIVLVNGLCKKG